MFTLYVVSPSTGTVLWEMDLSGLKPSERITAQTATTITTLSIAEVSEYTKVYFAIVKAIKCNSMRGKAK